MQIKAVASHEEDERIVRTEQVSSMLIFANIEHSNHVIEFLLNIHFLLSKIKCILAWIVRFAFNVKSDREDRKIECLLIDEIRRAY